MSFTQLFERYCSIEEPQARLEFSVRNPALWNVELLRPLYAALTRAAPTSLTSELERVAELDAVQQAFAKDASSYPVGVGPIEETAQRVIDGELTFGAAVEAVSDDDARLHLSGLYVHVLAFQAQRQVIAGDTTRAPMWMRLLAHACLRLASGDKANKQTEIAGVAWIQTAGVLLGSRPSAETLQDARDVGERLLERMTDSKDATRRAGVLHALGSLYSDPVSASTGVGVDARRERFRRAAAAAELGQLGLQQLKQQPLPEPKDMLVQALEYFERALPDRRDVGRGVTLKAMAQTLCFIARAEQVPVDRDRVRKMCVEALTLLPEGDYLHQATRAILQSVGFEGARATEEQPLSEDSPHANTPDAAILHAQMLATADPHSALRILVEAQEVLDSQANEAQRLGSATLMAQLIPKAHGAERLERYEGTPAEVAEAVARSAKSERWSNDRLAATLFELASRCGKHDAEELGVELLQVVERLSPTISSYRAPVLLAYGELARGAAVNAVNGGRFVDAVRWYSYALGAFLRSRMPAMCFDIAECIADVCGRPAEDMVGQVIQSISPLAFEMERILGDPGTQALRNIYDRTMSGLGESVNPNLIGMLLQLAKGARFDALMRVGSDYDWRQDERAMDLHREIESLERQLSEADESQPLDDLFLITGISVHDATEGEGGARRLQNLRQSFDRHVTDRLIRSAKQPAVVNPDVIKHVLGTQTVLLDYYFARGKERRAAVYIIVYTREDIIAFCNPLEDAREHVVKAGEASAMLDSIALRTYMLREAIVQDAAGECMSATARERLTADFELLLGTPTWNHLEVLRRNGKSHLCIRPHGALRYYPLHLLGPAGEELARHWVVTTLPSFECLLRRPGPSRSGPGRAMGLQYLGDAFRGLPDLPEAKREVESVARIFGSPPLLDGAVTEASVLDTLRNAPRVHLCLHGAHNAAARQFHHLVVTPDGTSSGRLCAYELAGQDLTGLQVLSLGSCDSGLGRFDAGDNISGLPAAFLAAGVSTLVTALWEVADDAAATFFTSFYSALSKRASRLEAFHTALIEVRRAFPDARDWAVFSYVGDWDRDPLTLPPETPIRIELED